MDLSDYVDDDGVVDYTVVRHISSSASALIYSGRAYADDADECFVCINDVCEDELGHIDIDTLTTSWKVGPEVRTFSVRVGTATVDTVTFVNDWSYDADIAEMEADDEAFSLQCPISTDAVQGMFKVVSEFDTDGNVKHKLAGQAGSLNLCNAKALYYVNSLGGWDYLLLKGGCKESAEYDRAEYRIGEQRTNPIARERINYRNGVAQKWECHTGHITRQGGLRMGELFGSVDIRLWSADFDELVPVTIDEGSVQMLTVRNNGRQAVEYTFNITLAKERERR